MKKNLKGQVFVEGKSTEKEKEEKIIKSREKTIIINKFSQKKKLV